MHYQGRLVVDADSDQDQQLPFQKADCGELFNITLDEPSVLPSITQPVWVCVPPRTIRNTTRCPQQRLQEIFQPPDWADYSRVPLHIS
ncbi:MAG TPA: hypothetical protein VG870_06090 [Chitinophagaceae bacterium]|nr:hypothetical protein [Chitinophagaceae bacterium]